MTFEGGEGMSFIASFQLVSAKQELHSNLKQTDWLLSVKLDRSRAVRALARGRINVA